MNRNWWLKASGESYKELTKSYDHLPTTFQLITEDRVVINYVGIPKDGGEPVALEVHIVRQGTEHISIFIYQMKYIQGWKL